MGEQAAKTKKTETSLPEGKIVQVSGPVVDVKFESGPLPEIRDALTVENQGKTCVMEAAKHMGNNIVRCIMLSASEGLSRDMKVTPTGEGISVPVGEKTLGRLFNVLGETVDGGQKLDGEEHWCIHRDPPPFEDQSPVAEILETGIKVIYETFETNEDMYAKLKSGAVSYDVVIPSDYMIARMEAEDMLLPLNYDNIPNYQYISEDFRGLYYDPDDTYTVPYTYGIVGVIYNANVVDEADTGSWDLMWNPKYAGNILQFNNARDALGTAMYRAGIDVNTTDHADWQQALQALVDQRPLVKSYVMDEIYNMMESGEAAVAAYYAGDYFTMCDAQADSVDLQFYYPENTNYFIDAMCIPTSCRDQELAECFINFMLSREAAVANAEYIYYASPNRLVYDDPEYIDDMGEDTMAILYPDIGSFRDAYNRSAYRNLDQDTLTYVNSLWETLKIN